MADVNVRHLYITATEFDQVTTVSDTAIKPKVNADEPRAYLTATTVGRISYKNLARPGTLAAIVRVRKSEAANSLTMRVRTLSDAEAAAMQVKDNPLPALTNRELQQIEVGTIWSSPVLLGPTDALTFQGPRNAVDVQTLDFNSDTALATLEGLVAATGAPGFPQVETPMTAPGPVSGYGGHRVVKLTFAANGTVILPLSVDEPPGGSITFVRAGGVGNPRILAANDTDTVNTQVGANATAYTLRNVGDAVTYFPIVGGWVRHLGGPTYGAVSHSAAAFLIPAIASGLAIIGDDGTTLDNTAELPARANCGESAQFLIINRDTLRHRIIAPADAINSATNAIYYVQGRTCALATAVPGGWSILGGGNQGQMFNATGAVSPTAVEVSGGVATVLMRGAAGQDLLLPPVALVANGSLLVVHNTSGGAHDIIPSGTDKINGVNAATTDAAGARTLIYALGPNEGWVTLTSA